MNAAGAATALEKGSAQLAVQERTRHCLLGYAQYDLLKGEKRLKFGKYNYRPLNVTEGNKIFQSMVNEGIQRFDVNNSVPLIIGRRCIDMNTVTPNAHAGGELPRLKFTEAGQPMEEVIAAGGRHRVYVLGLMSRGIEKELEAAERALGKAMRRAKKAKMDYNTEVANSAITSLTERYSGMGMWMVAIYEQGKWLSSGNAC